MRWDGLLREALAPSNDPRVISGRICEQRTDILIAFRPGSDIAQSAEG